MGRRGKRRGCPRAAWPALLVWACAGPSPSADRETGTTGQAAADAEALNERGVTLAAAGEHARALAAFDSALHLEPDHPSALSNRGVAYVELARWDEALADFERVVELHPEEAKSWYDRAWVRDVRRDYEGAIADLTRAIELDSALAEAWLNRGVARARTGDLAGAIADLTRAVELDSSTAALKDRGVAYHQAGRYREAAEDFTRILRREPGQPRHYLRRARAYRGLGERERAEADLRHLLQITGNPEVRKQAIQELREMGAL